MASWCKAYGRLLKTVEDDPRDEKQKAAYKTSFEPYYETTLLSEATDPNLLYEVGVFKGDKK